MRRNSGPLVYRGTQGRAPGETVRGAVSFTPSLGAAIIWSAVPPDVFARRPRAELLSTSTVYAAHVHAKKLLELPSHLQCSMGDMLRALEYEQSEGYAP